MAMEKMTVRFTMERETKGAIRYQEVDKKGNKKAIADGATIGTLYLRKDSLNGNVPNNLVVSINES